MRHFEIEIKNDKGEYIAGWGRCDSIQDIKDCFYSRFNQSEFALTCKYLRFYNFNHSSSDKDYFKNWCEVDCLLFILESYTYYEEASIVVVD